MGSSFNLPSWFKKRNQCNMLELENMHPDYSYVVLSENNIIIFLRCKVPAKLILQMTLFHIMFRCHYLYIYEAKPILKK